MTGYEASIIDITSSVLVPAYLPLIEIFSSTLCFQKPSIIVLPQIERPSVVPTRSNG